MILRALLPAIHARPTGGNLYNRRLFHALRPHVRVERHIVGTDLVPKSGPWLIDSLIAHDAEALFAAGIRPILIAHYMHLLDPARRDSPVATRERELLPRFAGIIATSDYSRDLLRELLGSDTPVQTIWPGLDPRYRCEKRVPLRRASTVRLLTVANLLPGKGLLALIDVLETLADLDWRWELVGDATLDATHARAVMQRIARSPLQERMQVRPPLPASRLLPLYDRADLFVLPTLFETCSMVTREAMARALPVVAYDVGGLGANLPATTAATLAPPGDTATFAAQLRRLIADPRARDRDGVENRIAATAFPSWEQSAESLRRWLFA